jgi:organic hydroperoxide reductase OsmC/OhrA
VNHRYRATLSWSGSTGEGYEHYGRDHEVDGLPLSADPHFRGDPERLNPEVLLVMAAASCQLLSFLAVAARARIDVVAYEDVDTTSRSASPASSCGPASPSEATRRRSGCTSSPSSRTASATSPIR